MLVLGCDCSSKLIGCVLLGDDNSFFAEVLKAVDLKDTDIRFRDLFNKFRDFLNGLISEGKKPNVCYIEQAIYLQNVKTTLAIAGVIDAVRLACFMEGIPYDIIDNKTWKKWVVGNGKASKEQIMEFVKLRWGDKIISQDVADASAIALYGLKRMV